MRNVNNRNVNNENKLNDTTSARSKISKKNYTGIIILILIILIIIMLIAFLFRFSNGVKTSELVKRSLDVQKIVSEYIGRIKSETFDLYSTEQLIVGSSDTSKIEESKIKTIDNKAILSLVDISSKIVISDKTYYKIDITNFKTVFNADLDKEQEITWYIDITGKIGIGYASKPSWWSNDINAVSIYN